MRPAFVSGIVTGGATGGVPSLVTIPEVFAKVNSISRFILVSKGALFSN